MTVTGSWEVKCPTCKQLTTLTYQPGDEDYILGVHNTPQGEKCTSSKDTYNQDAANTVFIRG